MGSLKDIPVVIELVLIGFQVLLWASLLMFAIFGFNWIHLMEIILGGETAQDTRHLEHLVENVQRVAPLIGPDGLEEGVGFEDADGAKTILLFEKLPEIPEKTSDNRTADSTSAQR